MFQSIALANEATWITTLTKIFPWLQIFLRMFLPWCSRLCADGEPRRSARRSGSRSVLHGLAPDLDSDYSNYQAKLPLRSARLDVNFRRAGVSMDLGPTRRCMRGRDAQQHHGGSRSILHGLAPDLDSDYSNDQATLPLRSARSEVDVRRAGVSMDLGSTRLCMWPTSAICITVVLGCLGTYSLTFWLEAGIVEM